MASSGMDSPIGHNASSRTQHHAVLIPELAFEIQRHLAPRDLAVAARVCQAWFEAWTPFSYHSVRYTRCPPLSHHQHHLLQQQHRPQHHRTRSLSFGRMETTPVPVHDRLTLQPQAFVPPFLNLDRYGHWIRSLEVSHLFVYSCPSATPPSSLSVSPPAASSPSSSLYSSTNSSSVSTSSSSPLSSVSVPLVMDHLAQIQTCSSLHLTLLDLSRTAMSLERLDSLLCSLSSLRIFKFEVVNKLDGGGLGGCGSFGFGGSFGGNTGAHPIVRGYLQQHQGYMHTKPKRQTLEGQELEVIQVIAKRLSRYLERLELSFTAPARIAVSAFQELLDSCGATLKTLSLTRVEICEVEYGREISAGYHSEISALLASLMSSTTASASSSRPLGSFSHTAISSSTSSSSLASTYSTSASSFSSLQSRDREKTVVEPVLESLALHSCTINDKECEWLMKRIPGLRELTLHDCRQLNRAAVESILRHTPRLESLALSSVPNLCRQGLEQLFFSTTVSTTNPGTAGSSSTTTTSAEQNSDEDTTRIGFRLKSIRLAYLQQLDDRIMETLATHQGPSLERLSLQWCPHVTNAGIAPIFRHCERLQDLSLCLSKPTLAIFRDMDAPDTMDQDTIKPATWACAKTLERLEIGGPMFLERVRLSNEHLHPQLYHHLSPNPHHTRSRSVPSNISMGIHSRSRSGSGSGNSAGTGGNSNIIHNAYSVAHHEGYPMYHLLRYPRLSSPFKEMQAQLETLPRLTHLGIPAKGIEHCIKRGFGDKLRVRSLTLLNQQGRVWDAVEVQELLQNMPYLRRLYCEKNTIQMDAHRISPSSSSIRNMVLQKQQQEEMQRVLQRNGVELVQYSTGGGFVET